MTYDIEGWVEVRATFSGAEGIWQPVVHLTSFALHGSDDSSFLFGLARSPRSDARFAGRGLPDDASECLRRQYEADACWRESGEAQGYTHATFAEVREALQSRDAPPAGMWAHITTQVPILYPWSSTAEFRFVVWANW